MKKNYLRSGHSPAQLPQNLQQRLLHLTCSHKNAGAVIILAVLAFLPFLYFSGAKGTSEKIVASICDFEITQSDFANELFMLGIFQNEDISEREAVALKVLNQMVDEGVLFCTARKAGFSASKPEVDFAISLQLGDPFSSHSESSKVDRAKLQDKIHRRITIQNYLKKHSSLRLAEQIDPLKKTTQWSINQNAFRDVVRN